MFSKLYFYESVPFSKNTTQDIFTKLHPVGNQAYTYKSTATKYFSILQELKASECNMQIWDAQTKYGLK